MYVCMYVCIYVNLTSIIYSFYCCRALLKRKNWERHYLHKFKVNIFATYARLSQSSSKRFSIYKLNNYI